MSFISQVCACSVVYVYMYCLVLSCLVLSCLVLSCMCSCMFVCIVFYCIFLYIILGHGAQEDGQTFLIPCKKNKKKNIMDATIMLGRWTERLNKLPGRHVFILDCCRDDDDDTSFKSKGGSPSGFSAKGMPELPQGSKAAQFALLLGCDPGEVSLAGRDENDLSVLTKALLNHLKRGANLAVMQIEVINDAFTVSNGKQRAWYNASLRSQFEF